MENSFEIISYTPLKSPLELDVMKGDRWLCTVKVNVTVGVEYAYDELKSFVKFLRPSLSQFDFELLPCGKPRFV